MHLARVNALGVPKKQKWTAYMNRLNILLPSLLALSLSACGGDSSSPKPTPSSTPTPTPTTTPTPTSTPTPSSTATPEVVMIELEDFVGTGGTTFDNDDFFAGFQAFSGANESGINWNQNQDWGEYQVNFAGSATYQLEIRAGVPVGEDRNVRVYIDGYIAGEGALTSTGSFSTLDVQNVADNLVIYSGERTVRVESFGAEWQWNGDWIRLTPVGPAPDPTVKPPVNDIPEPDIVQRLNVEGNDRVYIAHLPKGYETGEPRPLVMMFHGGGGSANGARSLTQFNDISDQYGPIVIYPHGMETLLVPDGQPPQRLWDGFFERNLGDFYDVEFVQAVIAEAIDQYNVDPEKIFISGNSNGGLFVAGLICHLPDLFAGAAVNIATQIFPEVAACSLNPPMPIITSNGTLDLTFPYSVDRDVTMSIPAANEVYASRNGCDLNPASSDVTDIAPLDGSTVTKIEFQNCDAGFPFVHYRINGGGHHWPGADINNPVGSLNQDIDWSELQWMFFQNIIDGQSGD